METRPAARLHTLRLAYARRSGGASSPDLRISFARKPQALRIDPRSDLLRGVTWTPFTASARYASYRRARCASDCADSLRGKRARVYAAPDWIAEVLSLSTATYDRTTKLRVFERAGVPEVWLIDPTDRTVTIYRIADGQYGAPVVLELKGQTTLTAVPGVTIDWDDLLAT